MDGHAAIDFAIRIRSGLGALAAIAALLVPGPAAPQEPPEAARQAVVKVRAYIPEEARTARTLGTVRDGSGVVIDADGLIVTIGYVILEAMGAEIVDHRGRAMRAELVGYDADTGFGLLRATEPLAVKPAAMGRADRLAEGERVTVIAAGEDGARPALVVQRREFAGYWEYLLDQAVFIAPPHPRWAGAGLFTAEGKLVAIGSLLVGEVAPGVPVPGNMMIPIELLRPILGDLLALGRIAGPSRPWLGVNVQAGDGGIVVTRVQSESPAERAGLAAGDVIVGVGGTPVSGLADFYRKVWAKGEAGVTVGIDLRDGNRTVEVTTGDRRRYMKGGQTY
jgi:S1-C subfamily serine protease